MSDIPKSNPEPIPGIEALQADIATLKRDIAALMSHLKIGAQDSVNGAAGQISEEATRLYESLVAQGERSAKAIGRQVEEQPVLSLLVAFAVGFIGGRVLSR